MFAFLRLGEGLLFIHGILLLGFAVGTLVLPKQTLVTDPSPTRLAKAVAATALGLSLIGFMLLFLGFTFLLTPKGIIIGLASLLITPIALRGRDALNPQFWNARLRLLTSVWDVPTTLLYIGMLALSVPAIIPNLSGDPTTYHLTYALEWASAHGITIDPFLRLPFYANNFLLFFAAAFALKASLWVNFFTWGAALLTALGTLAAVRLSSAKVDTHVTAAIGCGLAAAVVLNPTFLRWMDTAYIDVPLGCFALMTLLTLHLAVQTKEWTWLAAAALIAGFFAGMKVSFIVLIPLIIIAMFIAARHTNIRRTALAATVTLFILTASPWYVRNLVMTGDPIPPMLNIAFHGDDGTITSFEWKQNMADFHMEMTPRNILTLPITAFVDPRSRSFREYGTTLLITLLYIPCLWLLWVIAGRDNDGEARLYAVFASGFVLYWVGISTLLRYSLILIPILAVTIGLLANRLASRLPRTGAYGIAALCCVFIISSPGSRELYRDVFMHHTQDILLGYTGEQAYLLKFGDGYASEQEVVKKYREHGLHGRLYTLFSPMGYYYRRDGISNAGDWFGPAGIFRLQHAIIMGCAANFFNRLNVDSVALSNQVFPPPIESMLLEQMHTAGYIQIPMTDKTRFFIRQAPMHEAADSQGACNHDPNWFLPA